VEQTIVVCRLICAAKIRRFRDALTSYGPRMPATNAGQRLNPSVAGPGLRLQLLSVL